MPGLDLGIHAHPTKTHDEDSRIEAWS